MRIAIIGAGFTGLSAAYKLQKQGHNVTVFEKDAQPGGLALGYQEKDWKWSLEQHYHHWFTNDDLVLNLAKEIEHKIIIKRPKTSVFLQDKIFQLDSPMSFLTFPKLPLIDRLRMVIALGFLRVNPFWKPLEKVKATAVLPKTMGKKAWDMLWKPQLVNKMGKYADDISLVWFWTRINKRTPSLAYPEGGFLHFAQHLEKKIEELGGKFYYQTEVVELSSKDNPQIKYNDIENCKLKIENFDAVIVTLPSFLFLKIAPQLPEDYKNKLNKLKSLGATNMVLRLNKKFMNNGTYWLSICETPSPVMVVIEHTNLMSKKNYNNEYLVYVGNYPDTSDPTFSMAKKDLLKRYDPLLKRINPDYQKSIIDYDVFRSPFAQPIVPTNYSKLVPAMQTPLPNVILANIEQVYPWDRGTNYAVELGAKAASMITA
ncbi:MAG TPA: FAD-dependent oxidoreductase [Patescibacteria group bacterium]|nr:FAD-dependent oxidoreductase [Patescibacteria group bacterium]